ANMRIGQPAKITTDFYGKKVIYHGRVQGLDMGTGSAFSLLPAQNASGNWIKVVQRLPVRISLDEKEVAEKPLRIGLSTEVTVDTVN
ncbi:HlyD family secretion protein, partial [Escherichia coli]